MTKFNSVTELSKVIFRAYDIRGIVDETLTPDVVYTIARALAVKAQELKQKAIIVAKDGRLSSPFFLEALTSGLVDSGLDVIDIGSVPTPLLYFATNVLLSRSGIMITGSHNPANYNGLKIVLDGSTLAGDSINDIYQCAIEGKFIHGQQGRVLKVDVTAAYIARILQEVRLKKPLKIVIDAGNGITGQVAPKLFRGLGCEVIELYCNVDGTFPNHHPDPSQIKNLEDLIHCVRAHQADLGLAFDGDGDRLGIVTNEGEIIWPDRQMMCFAIEILNRCKPAKILFDVKCSRHLKDVIFQHGGEPLMWKTGHSYIKNKMKETQAVLAGEMSGHIFFKDRWYGFDDALYAGARLLEIISQQDQDAATFFATLPNSLNTPELNVPVADEDKFDFMSRLTSNAQFPEAVINTIDGIRVDFPYGFGLVRSSNTTPNLVLRFEADTEDNLRHIQDLFRRQLLAINSQLDLPF